MADRINCDGCAYSHISDVDPNNLSAERMLACRRYPPTPIAVHTPRGVAIQTVYPLVTKANWCGEYLDSRSVTYAQEADA